MSASPGEENLKDFCRICLQLPETEQQLDLAIVYDEDEQLTYYDCLAIVADIELRSLSDNEPCSMCKSCGLELQITYDFYKKVEESKKLLKQIIQEHIEQQDSADDNFIKNQTEEEVKLNDESLVESSEQCGVATIIEECISDVEQTEEMIHGEQLGFERLSTNNAIVEDCATEDLEADLPNDCVNDVYTNTHNDLQPNNYNDMIIIEQINILDAPYIAVSPHKTKCHSAVTTATVKMPRGQYKCEHCDRVFSHHSRMLSHSRIHDAARPRFECGICGREYATKPAYKVHVAMAHSDADVPSAAAFSKKCPICGKIFAINKLLVVHMRYHTGDFPYECDLCGRKFAQNCHLRTHKSVKHNNSRFACQFPQCNKLFTSSSSLRNHEFSHSGMPFECVYCARGYPSKAKLKVHVRVKHAQHMSAEQLEQMRKFRVTRSVPKLVKLSDQEAQPYGAKLIK